MWILRREHILLGKLHAAYLVDAENNIWSAELEGYIETFGSLEELFACEEQYNLVERNSAYRFYHIKYQ